MRTTDKQHIITTIIGFIFILLGFSSSRFLIIRPNRIVNGIVMNITAVFNGRLALIAAFFLVFALLLIAGYFKRIPWFVYTILASTIGLYVLFITGVASIEITQELSSAARTSFGIGFWFFAIGIIIIIESTLHYNASKANSSFAVFSLLALIVIIFYKFQIFDNVGIIKEVHSQSSQFKNAILEHMLLAISASTLGLIIGSVMSYIAYTNPKMKEAITGICNMIQVIPTLSMLGFLMIPLTLLSQRFDFLNQLGIKGIGTFPAFIVLTGYTLLPIVNSILSGLESIHPDILVSAYSMGMEKKQVLSLVEIPLTLPSILTGYRLALVQSIGNAILAGLIGGGGIGRLLFLGLAQSAPDLVIAASLAIMSLALLLNSVLSWSISLLRGYGVSYDSI